MSTITKQTKTNKSKTSTKAKKVKAPEVDALFSDAEVDAEFTAIIETEDADTPIAPEVEISADNLALMAEADDDASNLHADGKPLTGKTTRGLKVKADTDARNLFNLNASWDEARVAQNIAEGGVGDLTTRQIAVYQAFLTDTRATSQSRIGKASFIINLRVSPMLLDTLQDTIKQEDGTEFCCDAFKQAIQKWSYSKWDKIVSDELCKRTQAGGKLLEDTDYLCDTFMDGYLKSDEAREAMEEVQNDHDNKKKIGARAPSKSKKQIKAEMTTDELLAMLAERGHTM